MKYTYEQNKKKTNFKSKVKIHNHDTWDFGCTLSPIILPMLIQLKKTKQGTPFVLNEDVPVEIRTIENTWNEVQFDWILDQMIFSFDHLYQEANNDEYEADLMYYATGVTDYGKGLKHGPNHTYEIDRDKLKIFQDRVQKGFELFGKYFQNLWD
jgi:hypothetical protein